jgi:hypothetical protein
VSPVYSVFFHVDMRSLVKLIAIDYLLVLFVGDGIIVGLDVSFDIM